VRGRRSIRPQRLVVLRLRKGVDAENQNQNKSSAELPCPAHNIETMARLFFHCLPFKERVGNPFQSSVHAVINVKRRFS
jgi:hypothetical protein